ncbi:MAG: glycosyltransferase family 2 protein [Oscillospiraceae bacterium]|nr:glycosyltransferase family 2 protein [Oscillospiraceae bacterium]MDY2510033.1 glycosyltransferase family 2 protein [Ruminococcus callidus]
MQRKDKISVIVPCYNEEDVLSLFLQEVEKVFAIMQEKHGVEMEYLFVDDGSRDGTFRFLKQAAKENPRVNYLSFSRNFGKEAAMFAGLEHATGDYVVILDADLQDPPELMIEMYETLQTTEYDCVASCRVSRKGESKIRSFFARVFYKIIRKISKVDIVDGARDFRMMTRQMTDAVLSLKEYNRFSKGIFAWVGFRTKWIPFENRNREAGTTKWSFWGLLIYAIDGILAFSTAPLALSAVLGILLCLAAMIMTVVIIVKTLVFGDRVTGWPSLACIICFTSGISMFCSGIIGLYVSKVYSEVKGRPQYILKEQHIQS